jgi:hypothetical protein
MKHIFLVINQDGNPIKCFSSLKKAFKFVADNNYHFEYRELTSVTEMEVNGDSWGIHHSLDEM